MDPILKRAYRGHPEILRGWVADSSNWNTLYWIMTNESLLSFDSLNLRWEEGLGHDHCEPLHFLLGLQTYSQQKVTVIAIWAAANGNFDSPCSLCCYWGSFLFLDTFLNLSPCFQYQYSNVPSSFSTD